MTLGKKIAAAAILTGVSLVNAACTPRATPGLDSYCSQVVKRDIVPFRSYLTISDIIDDRKVNVMQVATDKPRADISPEDFALNFGLSIKAIQELQGDMKLVLIPGDYYLGMDAILIQDILFTFEGRVYSKKYVIHYDRQVGDSALVAYGPRDCFVLPAGVQ